MVHRRAHSSRIDRLMPLDPPPASGRHVVRGACPHDCPDTCALLTTVENGRAIAIRGAREKGEAIAIGHPHAVTLEALREMLPEAKKQGVRLVLVSDVVH